MWSWLQDQWNERPGTVILGVMGSALVIDAAILAAADRRPVGAFFEAFVALCIYWGSLVGGPIGGYLVGTRVYSATAVRWLGWSVGLTAMMAVWSVPWLISKHIPGVDRFTMQIIRNASERNYEP